MKYALCSLIVVIAIVAFRQPVQAQPCHYPFKANNTSSSSYIEYCVRDNGNITEIKTPFNVPQSYPYEGYGLCQESPTVAYYDYFDTASDNWGSAQILSVSGSSIKIKRSTGDGNWTLEQTIAKVVTTGSIKLVMALTNNQSVAKVAYLLRGIIPYVSEEPRTSGASLNGVWSWENSSNTFHYGLQLLSAGKSPFAYRQGFVKSTFNRPNPCDFAANTSQTGVVGPNVLAGWIFYVYAGAVPAGATRTVTLNYRGT